MMEMMNVEIDTSVHASTLRDIIDEVTRAKPDVRMLTLDGESVWTHRMLLMMNSNMFSRMMEDMKPLDMEEVTISIPILRSETLRTLLTLLQDGEVFCQNELEYTEAKGASQILGISLVNLQIEWEKRQEISDVHVKIETDYHVLDEKVNDRSSETNERESHQCTFCEKMFTRKYNLAHHISRLHSLELKNGEFKHKNIKVDDEFIDILKNIKNEPGGRKSVKKNDGVVNNDIKAHSLECKFCAKVLSRKDKLTDHLRRRHNLSRLGLGLLYQVEDADLKKLQCKYCSKILSRPDKLNQHIKKIHSSC